MQIHHAIKALTDAGVYTFSNFPSGDNTVERSITNAHTAFHNRDLRNNYRTLNTGDPLVRFVLLATDNKLKVVYCPMLIENRFFNDEEPFLLLALMGDEFTQRQLVRLPAKALNDVVACVASDADGRALDIVPSELNVSEMWKDCEAGLKINTTTDLQWPSTDYPHNVRVTLMPKMLCLPPNFEAFHGHLVTSEFPPLSDDQVLWKYHEPWRKIAAYAVGENRDGLSLHADAHPHFDISNWNDGAGRTFIEKGGDDLHESWYTEYETIDNSSDAAVYAMSMINPNLIRALRFGASALPQELPPPPTAPPAIPGHGGPPFGDNPTTTHAVPMFDEDWCMKLQQSIAMGMTTAALSTASSKETASEKEKKKEAKDAQNRWRLLLAGYAVDEDGNILSQVAPGKLSEKWEKMLEIQKADIAKQDLEVLWRKNVAERKSNRKIEGLFQQIPWGINTAAFCRTVQRCLWHSKALANCKKEGFDKKLSAICFC